MERIGKQSPGRGLQTQQTRQRRIHKNSLEALKKNTRHRQPGTLNRFTTLKHELFEAFYLMGGIDELVAWVKRSNANQALFYRLIVQLMPTRINMDIVEESHRIEITPESMRKIANELLIELEEIEKMSTETINGTGGMHGL